MKTGQITPIPSKPAREPSDPRSMRTSQLSANREPGSSLEVRPMTLMDGHRDGVHVPFNHFPVGSRVVMLPVLVIAPEDPRDVLHEREDSGQKGSGSASREGGGKALVSAPESPSGARSEQSRYVYGPLVLDTSRHEVHANGHEIELTPKEFGLLESFLKSPGHVRTREALLNAVWGYDYYGTTRTVDVHVRRLKQKIPLLESAIVCVRSLGYKLRENLGSVL